MNSHYKSITITNIVSETDDVKTFTLRYTDGAPLIYQAGQFITLVFMNHRGGESRRSYSFSTTPDIDTDAAITLKRIPNGEYSRQLIDHARVGDTLWTIGASGNFTEPDVSRCKQLFFLAAGSGITPVFSLLKLLLKRYPALPIVLIYSNRNETEALFYNPLKELQHRYKQLRIEFLFSNTPNLLRARLTKLSLENLLAEYSIAAYQDTLFYLCGPFDYMRTATIVLQTEGVPHDHIRRENFAIVKPVQRNEPADKMPHQISLAIQGQHYAFITQYPETILQKAKELAIAIPYSCESGQCGTCAATCTKGQVWMWNNEVLTDAEIANGRVLTCTGYPVGGDVIIEI